MRTRAPQRVFVIPPSCDAELVAFWVEHHDMTEVLAVGPLADSRSPGGDQLGWCVWRGRVPLLRVTGDRTGRPSGRRRRRDGGTSNQPSSRIATHRPPQAPSRRAPPAGTTRAQSELGVSWCPRYRCPHPFRHSTRTSEHRKDPPENDQQPNPVEGPAVHDVLRHHTVGLTGFEPAASSSRTTRATKLRHSPRAERVYPSRSASAASVGTPHGLRTVSVTSVASG